MSTRNQASTTPTSGSIRRGWLPFLEVARGGVFSASGARYFFTVRQSQPTSAAISVYVAPASRRARNRLMFIQDSASRIMGNGHPSTRQLAGFETKGDLHPRRVGLNSPNTD